MADTIIVMVIKPFSLFTRSCMAVLRGFSIVINTWVEILSAAIYFHVSIFWRLVVWTVTLVTLPARALSVLQREKQLKANVIELQNRLDTLAWDREELEEQMKIAIKEYETMEAVLGQLEEEHEQAVRKVKLLESQLQDAKDENLRLKEVYGKSHWDAGTRIDTDPKEENITHIEKVSPWKSTRRQVLVQKDPFEVGHKSEQLVTGGAFSDDVPGERRDVALSQSLFSALLSLLVGMVVWESKDPCMPLVAALFMVVGMSLKSVVRFFSTVRNKPATDAVALLSLNWFILGTLTYPMLPRFARLLAPVFVKLFEQILGWFALFFVVY